MRHRKRIKQFTSSKEHTTALFNNLATALIKHERIVTTLAKAKELRRVVDKIITLGKRDSAESKMKAKKRLKEPDLVPKVFGPLKERYASRAGGYTRLLKIPDRKFDGAKMAVIELVDNPFPPLREPRIKHKYTKLQQPKREVTNLYKMFERQLALEAKENSANKMSEPKETEV